jgi:hypothetical protein
MKIRNGTDSTQTLDEPNTESTHNIADDDDDDDYNDDGRWVINNQSINPI